MAIATKPQKLPVAVPKRAPPSGPIPALGVKRCKAVPTEQAWERGRQSMKTVGHGVGRSFFKGIGANDIVSKRPD